MGNRGSSAALVCEDCKKSFTEVGVYKRPKIPIKCQDCRESRELKCLTCDNCHLQFESMVLKGTMDPGDEGKRHCPECKQNMEMKTLYCSSCRGVFTTLAKKDFSPTESLCCDECASHHYTVACGMCNKTILRRSRPTDSEDKDKDKKKISDAHGYCCDQCASIRRKRLDDRTNIMIEVEHDDKKYTYFGPKKQYSPDKLFAPRLPG